MDLYARFYGFKVKYSLCLSATVLGRKIAYFAYSRFYKLNITNAIELDYTNLSGATVIDFVNPTKNQIKTKPGQLGQLRYFNLETRISLTDPNAKYGAYKGKIACN